MKPFWIQVSGPALAQGDLLPDCLIPVFTPEVRPGPAGRGRHRCQGRSPGRYTEL